jgi:hypothetical protein
MRTDILAGDRNGDMVAPGYKVIYRGKERTVVELYEEHDEVSIGLQGARGILWVDEDQIELVDE